MKRTFIRICGTVLAGVVGMTAKQSAYASEANGCPVVAKIEQAQGFMTTGCPATVVQKLCVNNGVPFGTGNNWVSTGTYGDVCWCSNVETTGNGTVVAARILCKEITGTYSGIFSGCGTVTESAINIGSKFYGACDNTNGNCYYSKSSKCASGYDTTGEVLTNLKTCCTRCLTGGVNVTPIYNSGEVVSMSSGGRALVYHDEYSGIYEVYGTAANGWVITGDGKTGTNATQCKYIAQGAVTDDTGTFVAGNGGSYTCTQ